MILLTPSLILVLQANLTNNLPELQYRAVIGSNCRQMGGFQRLIYYSKKVVSFSIRQLTG
jgi:hypothetical protein